MISLFAHLFRDGTPSTMNLRLCAPLLLVVGCQSPVPTLTGPFWTPGPFDPAQRFELAKRSTPKLIAFLRRMPKGGDLHNHLGGATYGEYLLDSAHRAGKHFDLEPNTFVDEAGTGRVSTDQLMADPQLLAQYRNAVSMRGWFDATSSGHDHFFETFQHIGSSGRAGSQMLAEVLLRNRYQSVQYLELMATPRPAEVIAAFTAAYRGFDANDLEGSFARLRVLVNDPEIHTGIRDAVDQFENGAFAVLREQGIDVDTLPAVRYLPSLNRVGDLNRFFVAAVIFMTAVRADPRIVAVNMVAPEDAPASRLQFDTQMKILDYLWREMDEPNLALHSGELSLSESPVEPMWDRIRRTIDEGHARRIGHGVSIAWERDLVGLLEQMRTQGVLVEVSLTSSESILGIKDRDHPTALYRRAGVPICLCTDDEGVSRSNLTMEYVKAVQRYGLAYDDLKKMSRDCLVYSFLPATEKRVHLTRLDAAFAAFEAALANGYREMVP